MTHPHDTGYKLLFSTPELMRDLILGFVPDDWLHSLDYTTLEKVPGSYVSDDLRERADDVVWRVQVGGDWVYLYLLLEFQSTVDRYMAVRLLVYVGLLYQDLIRQGNTLTDGRLPPVLPIVLYNGSQRWSAAQDIADLIPPVPGLVAQFKPQLRYLLIDENAYGEAELASLPNLVAAVFRLEHPQSPQQISQLLEHLSAWLVERPDLRRMFAGWIRATLQRKPGYALVLPEVNELQELKVMLAERMEQWANEYRAEGELKGRQQGEALTLQKLLAKRFGPLPEAALRRIAAAPPEHLEIWLERLLDAPTLDAVLAEPEAP